MIQIAWTSPALRMSVSISGPWPTRPSATDKGTQSVRSLGDLRVLGEGRGEMPGGGMATTLLTLGDTLDTAEKMLTLSAESPSFAADRKLAKYQDVITLETAARYRRSK